VPPNDPGSFGRAIAQLRKNQGLTQKEVADRLSTYYSDDSAYRRIENGKRLAGRAAAIAILVQGLLVTDLEQINSCLALAGYNSLSADEAASRDLQKTEANYPSGSTPENPGLWNQTLARPRFKSFGIVLAFGSIVLSVWIASRIGEWWFPLVSSMMYAALYVASLFLESAYEFDPARVLPAAIFAFCFMLSTSVAALAVDARCVALGKHYAMWLALTVFVLAGVLQWLLVRPALPAYTIVKTSYPSHTAQSAHLKNTEYFLFIVLLFWLPPFHCISVLRREAHLGNSGLVRELLGHWFLVGKGILCLNVEGLWVIFFVIIVAAMLMRGRLLDSLEPHPMKNFYTTLFYARALIYFTMCIVCISWYADSIRNPSVLNP